MFATGLRPECFDCLRILRRDCVAESCHPECYTCHYVRIEYGKRVLLEDNKRVNVVGSDSQEDKSVDTKTHERVSNPDKELE